MDVPKHTPSHTVSRGDPGSVQGVAASARAMSERRESAPTTAAIHGPRWGARAADWAELCAGTADPAREAVAEATGIGAGVRVLDIGCGSGEFCRLAVARGAVTSGIDAAEGMIEVARLRVPGGDLRVGAMERLPWDDDGFDVVTGFNVFQFAANFVAALAEARRVARPGGQVAICNWAQSELFVVLDSLYELAPPPPPGPPPPDPPAIRESGVVEELAREVGLEPVSAGEVDVPFELRDQVTLGRALLAPGGRVRAAIEHSGEEAVRNAIVEAATPFKRPDGSYRLENTLRYVITRV